LVDEGIVKATEMGRNRVHELNRQHLAAPVADILAGLRPKMFDQIRAELARWKPKAYYACVFGSAARGDGGTSSDIDLLVVHAPFPGDPKPQRRQRLRDSLAQKWAEPAPTSAAEARRWPAQVDRLKDSVHAWTGNSAQVVDLSWAEWMSHKDDDGIFAEIARDGVDVTPKAVTVNSLLFSDS
jgi:predicted nucleotidyltransferase